MTLIETVCARIDASPPPRGWAAQSASACDRIAADWLDRHLAHYESHEQWSPIAQGVVEHCHRRRRLAADLAVVARETIDPSALWPRIPLRLRRRGRSKWTFCPFAVRSPREPRSVREAEDGRRRTAAARIPDAAAGPP